MALPGGERSLSLKYKRRQARWEDEGDDDPRYDGRRSGGGDPADVSCRAGKYGGAPWRVDALNPKFNAIVSRVDGDLLLREAAALDEGRGERLVSRAVTWLSARREGHRPGARDRAYPRFAVVSKQYCDGGFAGRRTHASGGRDLHRQDQCAASSRWARIASTRSSA